MCDALRFLHARDLSRCAAMLWSQFDGCLAVMNASHGASAAKQVFRPSTTKLRARNEGKTIFPIKIGMTDSGGWAGVRVRKDLPSAVAFTRAIRNRLIWFRAAFNLPLKAIRQFSLWNATVFPTWSMTGRSNRLSQSARDFHCRPRAPIGERKRGIAKKSWPFQRKLILTQRLDKCS